MLVLLDSDTAGLQANDRVKDVFGGDDSRSLFLGPGASTIADVWRGRIESVEQLGDDLKVELAPVTGESCSPG